MTNMNSMSANSSAKGFNFFPPRTLRLMDALGTTTLHAHCSTFAIPYEPTLKHLACKRAAILHTHPTNEQHICLMGSIYNNILLTLS